MKDNYLEKKLRDNIQNIRSRSSIASESNNGDRDITTAMQHLNIQQCKDMLNVNIKFLKNRLKMKAGESGNLVIREENAAKVRMSQEQYVYKKESKPYYTIENKKIINYLPTKVQTKQVHISSDFYNKEICICEHVVIKRRYPLEGLLNKDVLLSAIDKLCIDKELVLENVLHLDVKNSTEDFNMGYTKFSHICSGCSNLNFDRMVGSLGYNYRQNAITLSRRTKSLSWLIRGASLKIKNVDNLQQTTTVLPLKLPSHSSVEVARGSDIVVDEPYITLDPDPKKTATTIQSLLEANHQPTYLSSWLCAQQRPSVHNALEYKGGGGGKKEKKASHRNNKQLCRKAASKNLKAIAKEPPKKKGHASRKAKKNPPVPKREYLMGLQQRL